MLQRPGRSALTALGTVLGVGAFVAVLGLTTTANSQINERFNALSSTEVSIELNTEDPLLDAVGSRRRRRRDQPLFEGSAGSGRYWTLDSTTRVSEVPPAGVEPGVRRHRLRPGGVPGVLDRDPPDDEGRSHVRQLPEGPTGGRRRGRGGEPASRSAGSTRSQIINDVPFTVIGVIAGAKRVPDTLLSVTIPADVASRYWGRPDTPSRMIVETEVGAAQRVADEAPLAPARSPPSTSMP